MSEEQEHREQPYRLYGAYASLYTGKTRSYLRKKGILFEEHLPCTPHFRQHVTPHVGNKRIPMLEAPDGSIVQDSTEIFDFIEARHPHPSALPPGPRQRLTVHLFELFADVLTRLAWHFRWNFPEENLHFVVRDFGRSFKPQGSDAELDRYGRVIADQMEGKRPSMGITAELFPVFDAIYDDLLDCLEAHFTSYPYLLGGLPSAADFALMGPLFAHLGRDPYPLQLMQRRAPRVFRWVEHMNTPEIRMPEFSDWPQAWLADDEVPLEVVALLAMLIRDFGSLYPATAGLYNQWAAKHLDLPAGCPVSAQGEDQPSMGPVVIEVRGHQHICASAPHGLWILQRSLTHLEALGQSDRRVCDAFAAELGARELLDITLMRRLTRTNYRLAVG